MARKYNKGFSSYLKYIGEYRIWNTIKQRCYNPRNREYDVYGGRGIKMCNRWLGDAGFENFYNDMGQRPCEDNGRPYQIDRIDNSKGYSPDNCRWATARANQQNRRNNKKTFLYGDEMCLTEICRVLSLKRTTVSEAIRLRGLPIEDAIVHCLSIKYKERIHE